MKSRHSAARRRAPFALLLTALALVGLAAFAGAAAAAPPTLDPTMDLTTLGTALESGPMDGYMLTTMQGYTPEQIPVTVSALISYGWGSLILFEATGPQIDRIGGIAAGMSGSPVYVDDGTITPKLIGAVSYGDSFTRGGTGLATPIEYMTAVEAAYPAAPLPPSPGTYKLDAPVRTGAGTVRSLVVARSVAAATRVTAADGQLVMAPLGLLEIGGLRPDSKGYAKLAAEFGKSGLMVRPASGDGSWAGPPAPALAPGSPCAVLYSTGSAWVGAAGTVTYVNDDTVMMFGHPLDWLGPINAVMSAGYVEGVWPSNMAPYKMIAPRDAVGTAVQDRNAGVKGRLGQEAQTFPLTTNVELTDAPGHVFPADVSRIAQVSARSEDFAWIPSESAYASVLKALDNYWIPGSAETTTTVVVGDSTGDYTIDVANLWDDGTDVGYTSVLDIESIMYALTGNPDGVLNPTVKSVVFDARVSTQRRGARLANVKLPQGLRVGANPVTIEYYPWGSSTLKTLNASFTLPAGTAVNGELLAEPGAWYAGMYGDSADYYFSPRATGSAPQTLAELVADINEGPKNSDLLFTFYPDSDSYQGSGSDTMVEARVATDVVFDNEFDQETISVRAMARPQIVRYGGDTRLFGWAEVSQDLPVSIYRRVPGSNAEVLLQSLTAKYEDGAATFKRRIANLTRNTTLVIRTGATAEELPGSATVKVKVSAAVRIGAKGDMVTIRVRPSAADGGVALLRKTGAGWARLRTVRITNGRGSVKLPSGTYTLMARFAGSSICAPGVSPATTVTVR